MSFAAFIINTRAGATPQVAWGSALRTQVERVADGGPVHMVSDGDQLARAVQQSLDARCAAIVAGGGDGTVNAVASRLVGSQVTLGVLPLGTLNHFAKDLRIPLDPMQALATVASGQVAAVDVGEVNGHYFLNNSSLGLYPEIVRRRERQQLRLGRGRWAAFAWALWSTLRRYPFLKVQLNLEDASTRHRTPFVFVGNNAYRMEGLQIGERLRLDAGMLSIYLADNAGRTRLIALGLRALLRGLGEASNLQAFEAERFAIATHKRRVRVAIDGEIRVLDAPLRYRIHPSSLRVFVPGSQEAG